MNKELLKLKRELQKVIVPSREKQVCMALQHIFHDKEVGLTDKEAFTILGWEYESKKDLFRYVDKDKIDICDMGELEPMIINRNTNHQLEGGNVINLVLASDVQVTEKIDFIRG